MSLLQPKKEQAITGTVIGRNGLIYTIKTKSGRTTSAISKETWAIGASVSVLGGAIIGAAGRSRPATTYQV